mmetsp:Transcript_3139/g.7320  ORF Transcript_3139/g.7320 Transcript_3139/m.7320 type:complete len:309 (-) Transcript_3139:509-1435(-)|eukprot:CAMPEP_0178994370 /NCGR_PEP_ID=MMETSP0795-20121207/7234_1 /TAXON_ID=88552 /ORGANISM="Amoebophrya sp., Strain Ameob2" /LENGTH=308 /DNA_ID=CAMNT_0020686559 /DNA_START=63 /DNA_END=989 /DNA_ORIENTATION=-
MAFSDTWSLTAHAVGCLFLAKSLWSVCNWAYICFFRPGKDLRKTYGEWAVVTGATDGIGKAMAVELSKLGMKVILLSRTQQKLEETAKELKTESAVLAVDFANFDKAAREKVKQLLAGKDIGVLVNNVGISYDHPAFFHEVDSERVEALVELNINATTRLTHDCLPAMLAKKAGAVVNIASIAGVASSPLLTQYSASKAYVIRLTEGLGGEYKGKGVDFQAQYPHLITTKLAKLRHPSLTVPTPETYAKAAVRAIGYDTVISPYFAHYVLAELMSRLPASLQDFIGMQLHLPIRKRALKKKADAAKTQ